MKKFLFLMLATSPVTLLVAPSAFAAREVTRTETTVYSAPDGAAVATLKAGIPTECGTTDAKGYCKISLSIDVKPDQAKASKIKAGEPILFERKEIGKATLNLDIFSMAGEDQGMIRNLFIKAADLDPHSLAETELSEVLKKQKSPTSKTLAPYLNSLGFKKDETTFKPFTSYEADETLGDSLAGQLRIFLIFDLKDHLVAVIHDQRPLAVKPIKKAALLREYELNWFSKPVKEDDLKRVIEQFNNQIGSAG